MGFYLVRAGYGGEVAKAMIKKPHDREKAVRKTIEALGGKLHSFFFSLGDYDAVAIIEMPDNITAAASALGAAASGAVSKIHTTALLTAAEAMDAMTFAAKKSKPPK